MEIKTYPRYMNHKDHDPVRVDSRAAQTDMENKGWTVARIFKEYPKWVKGKLVHSRPAEERLKAAEYKASRAGRTVPSDIAEEQEKTIDVTSKLVMSDEEFPIGPEDAFVVKETQVDGKDTIVFASEDLKKKPGRPKKK